jgi:hypothetical protein
VNEVRRLLRAVEATGNFPHFKGWCPCHADKPGGHQSLDIDFDNRIGVVDIYIHCRSQLCGVKGTDVASALGTDWPSPSPSGTGRVEPRSQISVTAPTNNERDTNKPTHSFSLADMARF